MRALGKLGTSKLLILMLVIDGAAYMFKVGESLNIISPNLLHITCMFHASHFAAERIQRGYTDI